MGKRKGGWAKKCSRTPKGRFSSQVGTAANRQNRSRSRSPNRPKNTTHTPRSKSRGRARRNSARKQSAHNTNNSARTEAPKRYNLRKNPKQRVSYVDDSDMSLHSPARKKSGESTTPPMSPGKPGNRKKLRTNKSKGTDANGDRNSHDNRALPNNRFRHDMESESSEGLTKSKSFLSWIEPTIVNDKVTFDVVGGHEEHIRKLKEMTILPLVMPDTFDYMKIDVPKGVLFYGPPGTGKTLVAGALANCCKDKEVTFFMRKGADCLTKWVGESERILRALFEKAKQCAPSIIFFDEIDGLAPVRCSRQDQIHSSLVSTLLAMMDGLDARGQVIVIGATNRIDSIDPALRRPGRFDREFYFDLPNCEARRKILKIRVRDWPHPVQDSLIVDLAEKTVGYCGADLKSLCTEAQLAALRGAYPQIHTISGDAIDNSRIFVTEQNFFDAMAKIVPAAQRCVVCPRCPLAKHIKPLLQRTLMDCAAVVAQVFPDGRGQLLHDVDSLASHPVSTCSVGSMSTRQQAARKTPVADRCVQQQDPMFVYHSRVLLCGEMDYGQTYHIAPALIHLLDGYPVHVLNTSAMHGEGKSAEERCSQILSDAARTRPSVIYAPNIYGWWQVASEQSIIILTDFLDGLKSEAPVLFLATCNTAFDELPNRLKALFDDRRRVVQLTTPATRDRRAFFEELFFKKTLKPEKALNSKATSFDVGRAKRLVEVALKKTEGCELSVLLKLSIIVMEHVHDYYNNGATTITDLNKKLDDVLKNVKVES